MTPNMVVTGMLFSLAATMALTTSADIATNRYLQVEAQQSKVDAGYVAAIWKLEGMGANVVPAAAGEGEFNEYIAAWGNLDISAANESNPAANYIVRTPSSRSDTFSGDGFVIGSDNGDGALLLKSGNGNTVTFRSLSLVRGIIVNGDDNATETIHSSKAISVSSTAAHPFYFSGGRGRAIRVSQGFASVNEDSVIVVNRYSLHNNESSNPDYSEYKGSFTVEFLGDNSGYLGSFMVDGNSLWRSNLPGTAITLAARSLGGETLSALSGGVTLKNGGVLRIDGDADYERRGMSVESSGGSLVFASNASSFAMPISGDSTLAVSTPGRTSAMGPVRFRPSVRGAVSIDLSALPRIDLGVTAWDSTGNIDLGLGLIVEGPFAVLTNSMASKNGSYRTNGENWSDGQTVTDDSVKHYLVYGGYGQGTRDFRPPMVVGPVIFPSSAKLTFVGWEDSYRARLLVKSGTFSVANASFGPYSSIAFGGCDNFNESQELAGTLAIATSSGASRVRIGASANRAAYPAVLSASLTGFGEILYERYEISSSLPQGTHAKFRVTGDNSGYKGKVSIGSYAEVSFGSGANVGGEPDDLYSQGISMEGGTFVALDTFAIGRNRGVFVASGVASTIDVASGKTLTFNGPVSFETAQTTLVKSGSGVLTLAGTNTISGAIDVADGTLVSAHPYAAGAITVTGQGSAYLASLGYLAEKEVAKIPATEYAYVSGGSLESSPEVNLAVLCRRGWRVPENYGLSGGWQPRLLQTEVDGGVMILVSASKSGLAIIVR